MSDKKSEMKRILGAFYGQLIGDSLGSRYEFLSSVETNKKLQKDIVDNHLPLLGEGLFRDQPGQITDDSEMALSLARSLVKSKGFSHADVAASYVYWSSTNPPDIGNTIRSALSIPSEIKIKLPKALSQTEKEEILNVVLRQAKDKNQNSLSNGSLMRICPLGIALRNLDEKILDEIVSKECQITHSNPIAIQASQFYVRVLVNLLKGTSAKDSIENAKNCVEDDSILKIISDSELSSTPVKFINGQKIVSDNQHQGYFGIALQAALHEIQTSSSFEESLVRIIRIGGDTDTNGCICGVLMGAMLGVDSIPKDWIQTVLNAPIDRDLPFMRPLKKNTLDKFIKDLASLS